MKSFLVFSLVIGAIISHPAHSTSCMATVTFDECSEAGSDRLRCEFTVQSSIPGVEDGRIRFDWSARRPSSDGGTIIVTNHHTSENVTGSLDWISDSAVAMTTVLKTDRDEIFHKVRNIKCSY